MKRVYVIGTFDTKQEDLLYVAQCIGKAGGETITVDVSTKAYEGKADVPNTIVAACHPEHPHFLEETDDRGTAIMLMGQALGAFLVSRTDIGGVIGLGGSGNTAIITSAMRLLPIGLPKLMVSTMASGDVGGYVGSSDITMMYSVTDVAGLNALSRIILGNAAHAIAGMVTNTLPPLEAAKPMLGMTMYGVTTQVVMGVRQALQDTYDVLIFHATGRGGQTMEKLIDSQMIRHVIDLTTTEIIDYLFGGIMSAGKDRLGAIIRNKIPYVASVGAFDMITLGPKETLSPVFRRRLFHVHNPSITLIRTTEKECREAGIWLAKRLNEMEGPVRLLLPLHGLSQLDAPGQPFYDPKADQALFDAILATVKQNEKRKVLALPYHINDPAFTHEVVNAFNELHGI